MVSPTLLALPNEVLSQIIGYTVPQSIEKISLACKQLYRMSATSIAKHQDLKLQYDHLDIYALNDDYDVQRGKPAAIDILKAISCDHRIAWYTKSADLYASGYDWQMEHYQDESYVQSKEWYGQIVKEEDGFIELIKESRLYSSEEALIYQEDIVAASNPGPIHRHKAAAVLLLSLLPNVESLTVINHNSNRDHRNYLLMLIRKATHNSNTCDNSQPSPLKNLRSATFRHSDTHSGEDFRWLLFFAALPSMRDLEGEVTPGYDRLGPCVCPEKTSGVTSLILTRSVVSIEELTALLSAFIGLRIFHYMPGGILVGEDDYLPNELCIALQKYAGHSLEILKLGAEMNSCVYYEENLFVSTLKDFGKLKRLEIEASILLSSKIPGTPIPVADKLPESLEVLRLVGSYAAALVDDTGESRLKQDMQTLDFILKVIQPKPLALRKLEFVFKMWFANDTHQGQGQYSSEFHSYAKQKQEECGFEIDVIELDRWTTEWWSED